ncbi:MAG: DMT family transporter [Reyranellaceae bacterium]
MKDTASEPVVPVPVASVSATPTPAWPARFDRRLLLGILFIVLSGMIFPVMNGMAKTLGVDYNSIQISWARAFGHIIFMLMFFLPRFGLGVLRTQRPGVQVARSAMLFTSNVAFFFAITFIPIGKAASISMMAPLVVALLAWPMLGERTTLGRLVALGIGFAGVLIVIRPGTAVFHWASLLVMLSASSYALYQVYTRRIASIDSPETSALYSSAVGAIGMLFVIPFVWITPHAWLDIVLFCSLGVLGGLGHYCVARALNYAPANIVSPFQYFQLLGSVAVGYLVFDEMPDVMTWLGAAIIVASGLYIGWTQSRRKA